LPANYVLVLQQKEIVVDMKKNFSLTLFVTVIYIGLMYTSCVKRVHYNNEDVCLTMQCQIDSVYTNASNFTILPNTTVTDLTQVNFGNIDLKDFSSGSINSSDISLIAEHDCLSGVVMFEFAKVDNDIRIKAFAQNVIKDSVGNTTTAVNCPPQIVTLETRLIFPPILVIGDYDVTFKNKVGPDIHRRITIK
jgi:hypothetical protein